MTITVHRSQTWDVRACTGPQWVWSYAYQIDGGPRIRYGAGLASLRSHLWAKYPDAQFDENWQYE